MKQNEFNAKHQELIHRQFDTDHDAQHAYDRELYGTHEWTYKTTLLLGGIIATLATTLYLLIAITNHLL